MWVEILSLVACLLSLIDLWAFFFSHSPKSLSLHQFILICLLLKPGTRHVLFLVVGVSRLASFTSFLLGLLLGGNKRLFISNQVLLSSPTHLLYSPLLFILSIFFSLLHPLLTKHFFNDCGIKGQPFAACLWLACNLTSLHPLWQTPGSVQSDYILSFQAPIPTLHSVNRVRHPDHPFPTAIPVHQSVGSLDPVPFPELLLHYTTARNEWSFVGADENTTVWIQAWWCHW